jgi:predicted transposase/invertase (TIGR01784 family)
MKTINNSSPVEQEILRRARENIAQGKILNPMADSVFKSIFSEDSEDSKEALRSLLSDCTHRAVRAVQVRNSEIPPELYGRKTVRLDVRVTFNDGEQADLEMQVRKSDDDLKTRSLLIASKLMAGQVRKGGKYRHAKRVYAIFFLNCVLFPGSVKVPRRYRLREETERDTLSDAMEIIFYEMPKLDEQVRAILAGGGDMKNLRPEEKWCIFLKYRQDGRAGKLIEELCRQEEGIMRAEQVLTKMSREERYWTKALSLDIGEMDYNSDMDRAEERGIARGRVEGIASGRVEGIAKGRKEEREKAHQEKLEIARRMKNDGFSNEQIAKYSGLPSESVEKL